MHPSVLEAQSKSEAVVQLTVALKESNVPHLRWSQAPPCLGQGEAGSADNWVAAFFFKIEFLNNWMFFFWLLNSDD